MKRIATVLMVLCGTMLAMGSGFQLNEHSASGAAMGNAYTANVDNASAIFYNPGALAFVEGTTVNFGGSLVFPTSSWTSLDGSLSTDQKTKVNLAPSMYISYQLSDRTTVGIGSFSQYGLETDWPHGWPGTELADRTKIRTFFISPTASFKVTDDFSIGLQVNYVPADVLIQKGVNFVDTLATVNMAGDGDGWGFSGGFLWKINDRAKLGGFYRSSVDIDFEGKADFDGVPTPFLPVLYDSGITAGVELPETYGLGLSYQLNDQWLMEVGFQTTGWSSYSELTVRRDDGSLLTSVPKNWDDVSMYKIGFRYAYSDTLTMRFGYIYDENGAPDNTLDPSLPDSNRNDFSCGFNWKWHDFTISGYAMWVHFNSRTTTTQFEGFNGMYETDVLLTGVSLNYRF